ncbi:hypothetical protein TrVE_jg7156 [Triparma verrucosa]|uniref:Actin-like ATPase domain-containing protein n=1 Tax=Triparma verrucosa TaxID=1606542 RepID=A0A9W7FND9_9STRA|nr:hypothetical protein TrVE_jg7156 [Triparma verrucosa]
MSFTYHLSCLLLYVSAANALTIGLDLGTTVSSIAHLVPNTKKPELISKIRTRLLVADDGAISVPAFEASAPAALASLKSYTHKTYDDLDKRITVPGLAPPDDTEGDTFLKFTPHRYSVTTLQSHVVSHLLSTLKASPPESLADPSVPPSGIVVCVPALFTSAQKEATISTVNLAFSRVYPEVAEAPKVKIMTEPEACCLAYSVHSPPLSKLQLAAPSGYERTKLVFDFGGGTLDVSVVIVGYRSNGTPAGVEVIATMGDVSLGGDDMSVCLASHLRKKYGGNGWSLFAEEARVKLSSSKSLSIYVPLEGPLGKGLKDFEEAPKNKDKDKDEQSPAPSPPPLMQLVTVTRADFEKSMERLIPRLINPVRQVSVLSDVALLGDTRPGKFDNFFDDDDDDENEGDGVEDWRNLKKQQKGKRKGRREKEDRLKSYSQTKSEIELMVSNANPNDSVRLQDAPGSRPLDEVILCGGSSKTPLITRLLKSLTGLTPTYIPEVSPDDAVSLGAAVQCGIFDGVFDDEEDDEGGFGVMTPMQAALMRALAKKEGLI